MAPVDKATIARMLQLGDGYVRAGRLDAAVDAFRHAADLSPRNAQALVGMGWTLGLMGRNEQAAEVLKKAVSLEGAQGKYHYMLGSVLQRAGRLDDALAAFLRGMALAPTMHQAYGEAAFIYERTHRLDKARATLEKGLKVAPQDLHLAASLWSIRAREGEAELARNSLRSIIAALPASPEPASAAQVHFVLAQVEDQLGEYDRAFDSFSRANSLRLASLGERVHEGEQYLRRYEGYQPPTSEMTRRWASQSFDDGLTDPLFLVGFPRSGTTMLEQMLDSHPDVVAAGEKPMLIEVCARIVEMSGGRPMAEALDALTDEQARELRALYWQSAARHGVTPGAGQLLLDKHPLHINRLSVVNRLFPRAKVLVALRDPRDCCLSGFMQAFEPTPAMMQFMKLDTAARFYAAVMGMYLSERDRLTLAVRQVRYEDVVTDFQSESRAILEFLGLHWHDEVLGFNERARTRQVNTPSYRAVAQPVSTSAVGRWRRYGAQVSPILPTLERFVREFGYDAT